VDRFVTRGVVFRNIFQFKHRFILQHIFDINYNRIL
jgi:hypothetical protein